MDRPGFTASLVAGGVAGVSVDLILFPLDTIKTRLQSPQGFYKAGGFMEYTLEFLLLLLDPFLMLLPFLSPMNM